MKQSDEQSKWIGSSETVANETIDRNNSQMKPSNEVVDWNCKLSIEFVDWNCRIQ